MKIGDHRGQTIDQLTRDLLAVEQPLLREAAHPHAILEHRTRAADPRLIRGAGDGDHIEIEVIGQPAVEPQLLVAEVVAPLQGGKVEEAQRDGFLSL